MLRRSPFHDRVAAANETWLWSHWSGMLVVDRYQASDQWEYTAIRNAAGAFDSSPLHKYRVAGPDAERLLAGVLARDVRRCAPGRAQYTIMCDDRGFVEEDGVVFRSAADDFLLTTYHPQLAYLQDVAGRLRVTIDDVTDELGVLAVQGPRSHAALAALAPVVGQLAPFDHATSEVAGREVTVSRTGYTGDLGYELICPADHADAVWDAVFDAGAPHGLVPVGQIALLMARIEAGLLLVGVDFEPSRFAETDAHRSTPDELGLGWMLAGIDADDRPFVGRRAIRAERHAGTTRWAMRSIVVDWEEHDRVHRDAGLTPPKDHRPVHGDAVLYTVDDDVAGYATSAMYSPQLQRHIALARVRPDLAAPGTRVDVEVTVDHRYVRVGAQVARSPLFDPERRRAMPAGGAP